MLKVSVVRNRTIRKFLASFISSSLAVSMMSFTALADGEKTGKPVYDRDYTYQNILTDYMYFAEKDLTATSHQVGAFACGGDLIWGNGGQGQTVASYANNIVEFGASQNDLGLWIKDSDLKDKSIFAGSYDGNLSFIKENENFIDMDKAFKALESQSNDLNSSADYVATEDNLIIHNIPWMPDPEIALNINIDDFDGKNIRIPASLLDGVSHINITNNENNISMTDLARGGYVITFDDVKEIDLVFTQTCDSTKHANPVYLSVNADLSNLTPFNSINERFNNTGLATRFKTDLDRATDIAENDEQINLAGMNLLFNFPDADDVRLTLFEGHILAPNATVHVEGGHFEGGIIAENIDNSLGNEGHYYPFNTPETHDYPLVDPDDTTDPDEDDSGSTTDPDDGNGGTTDPDDGNGGSTTDPDDGNGGTTTDPDDGNGGTTTDPDDGNGGTTTDPDDGNGGSTTDPDDGNGGSTTDPDDGNGGTTDPDDGNGGSTTDPDDGNGGSTTDPDDGNGGSTTDPDDGNNNTPTNTDNGNGGSTTDPQTPTPTTPVGNVTPTTTPSTNVTPTTTPGVTSTPVATVTPPSTPTVTTTPVVTVTPPVVGTITPAPEAPVPDTVDLELLVVTDGNNTPIVGAEIEIIDSLTGISLGTVTTDETGKFIIPNIPVGSYTVIQRTTTDGYEVNEKEFSVVVDENHKVFVMGVEINSLTIVNTTPTKPTTTPSDPDKTTNAVTGNASTNSASSNAVTRTGEKTNMLSVYGIIILLMSASFVGLSSRYNKLDELYDEPEN